MQVAHSYQIDAELDPGWYFETAPGNGLFGPFKSEVEAYRAAESRN